MKKFDILLSPPSMGEAERELLLTAFDSNWIAPLGPQVDAFESEIAARAGVKYAVALSSGTAGLHLALVALGVGAGDEVMVSTLTFAATANAVMYCGARPVFIDSEESTWNLDASCLEAFLVKRAKEGRVPKALIVVDLYGQCADYDRILPLCERYGVLVVEDAAEALGATYRGRPAGSFGDAAVFSFNGNKIITTSGGGMFVTNDEGLAARVRFLATQAREPVVHYEHRAIGYNYRLSNLLAAVGRGQLRSLDGFIAARRRTFELYSAGFAGVAGLSMIPVAKHASSNHWLSCVRVDPSRFGLGAAELVERLQAHGIEARPVWKPMHLQPVFAGYESVCSGVAESLFVHGVCLPSGSYLTDEERQRVIDAVRGCAVARVPVVQQEL